MHKRSSKKTPKTTNQDVTAAVSDSTVAGSEAAKQVKNPAAVALGKLGGLKGGPARAAKLSDSRRREIAIKAAMARWSKREA